MTPEDILTLARQGNPKVIAAIMNRSVRSHGIGVQIVRRDDCLYVLLEGTLALKQEPMVSFVQTSMKKLRVEPIQTVRIYGRRQGEVTAAWKKTIALQSANGSTAPPSEQADLKALRIEFPTEPSLAEANRSDTIQTNAVQEPPDNLVTAQLNQSQSTGPNEAPNQAPADGENAPIESAIAPSAAQPIDVDDATATTEQDLAAFDQSSDELAASESGDLAEGIDFRALLQRPEALVLVTFVIAVFVWQFYLSLLEAVAPEGSLTTSELAHRLNVSRSTISRRKHQPDFSEWTQQLDPDAIAWVYTEGAFVPQLYQPDE